MSTPSHPFPKGKTINVRIWANQRLDHAWPGRSWSAYNARELRSGFEWNPDGAAQSILADVASGATEGRFTNGPVAGEWQLLPMAARWELDLTDVRSPEDLQNWLFIVFRLPGWHGRNWDAFRASITDPDQAILPAELLVLGWEKLADHLPNEAARLRTELEAVSSSRPGFQLVWAATQPMDVNAALRALSVEFANNEQRRKAWYRQLPQRAAAQVAHAIATAVPQPSAEGVEALITLAMWIRGRASVGECKAAAKAASDAADRLHDKEWPVTNTEAYYRRGEIKERDLFAPSNATSAACSAAHTATNDYIASAFATEQWVLKIIDWPKVCQILQQEVTRLSKRLSHKSI